MARIDRRRLLQLSGGGAVAAGTGGIAAILASGRAPAYAQTTSIHWLKFVDFVPVSDQLLRGKIAEECQKALGIKLNVDDRGERYPGAHHLGDPVRDWPRYQYDDQQLAA